MVSKGGTRFRGAPSFPRTGVQIVAPHFSKSLGTVGERQRTGLMLDYTAYNAGCTPNLTWILDRILERLVLVEKES